MANNRSHLSNHTDVNCSFFPNFHVLGRQKLGTLGAHNLNTILSNMYLSGEIGAWAGWHIVNEMGISWIISIKARRDHCDHVFCLLL